MRLPAGEQARRERAQRRAAVLRVRERKTIDEVQAALLAEEPGLWPLEARVYALGWTEVTGARQLNALLPHQGGSDPVGKGEFWRWMTGRREPSDFYKEKLCELLGCRWGRLWRDAPAAKAAIGARYEAHDEARSEGGGAAGAGRGGGEAAGERPAAGRAAGPGLALPGQVPALLRLAWDDSAERDQLAMMQEVVMVCEALGLGLAAAGQHHAPALPAPAAAAEGRVERMQRVPRRSVLAATAAGVGALWVGAGGLDAAQAERLQDAAVRPRLADTGVIGILAELLAAWRRADDVLGPRYLLRPVSAQLDMIEQLVEEARPEVRALLLPAAAEWAQFAWWLALDAGDRRRAGAFLRLGMEWAGDGGAPQIGGYLRACKSLQLREAGAFAEARRWAEAAQASEWQPTPALAAWARLREARALALQQDRRGCEAALLAADRALSSIGHAPEPAFIYHVGEHTLEDARAACYLDLGEGKLALAAIDACLHALPADRVRYQVQCFATRGGALALAGDLEGAVAAFTESCRLAEQTGSEHGLAYLRAVRAAHLPAAWAGHAKVRELDERVRQAAERLATPLA